MQSWYSLSNLAVHNAIYPLSYPLTTLHGGVSETTHSSRDGAAQDFRHKRPSKPDSATPSPGRNASVGGSTGSTGSIHRCGRLSGSVRRPLGRLRSFLGFDGCRHGQAAVLRTLGHPVRPGGHLCHLWSVYLQEAAEARYGV